MTQTTSPPEAWEPIARLARLARRPLEKFLHVQAASGILLMVAATVALVWANSPYAQGYEQFWHTPVGAHIGAFSFQRPLHWYVNDGLMVIFFFVVGMEIRREIYEGELSEWKRAALPVVGALGGMAAPAMLYLVLAGEPVTRSGWGVPMATDIAFAIGVLALLGKRVPAALRVLLLALAVIDDLGAIVVIAAFYSAGISGSGLIVAGAGVGLVVALRWAGVRSKMTYLFPGLIVWAGTYAAGVHPTIAGVVLGLLTPVRAWLGADGFVSDVQTQLDDLDAAPSSASTSPELALALGNVDNARREAISPAEGLIGALHPWVAYAIMPIFALANAGVAFSGVTLAGSSASVVWGVAVGLVVGKPLGVVVATVLALRLGLASLPRGLGVRHLLVLGIVAGIGFTMALFVAQLAFVDTQLLAAAKLGVLGASVAAGILSVALGAWLLRPSAEAGIAQSADEAEGSTDS